ncbi:MAG: tetratricopeptide repeat protein [Nitrospirae bacterium]|nr:tetratricopeptide repeat protein [Nitrospirota bacterium]
MRLKLVLIFLLIIGFTAPDLHANETGNGSFSPEPYFEDAVNQYKEGNLIDAMEKFRFLADNLPYISNHEISGTSLFMTGHIMEELGLDGAETYFDQVISFYPLIADYALFRSAESYERQDNYSEAARLFKRVYDSFPETGFKRKALSGASKNFMAAGLTKEAVAGFNKFLELYPRDSAVPEALYSIGTIYHKDGRESKAREYFNRIWIYHPLSREARLIKTMITLPLSSEDTFRRGTSYYDAGYYEEAIAEYKILLSLKKEVTTAKKKDAVFRIGMSYSKLRMSKEAEENLELFLMKYPYDEKASEALYWLGRNYLRQGKDDAFIASSIGFLKKYRSDDRYPEVLYRLGNIYAERNDIENAFFYLDRVLREYPSGSYAADSLWKKGWILYKAGDFDGALNTFNKIINSPEHTYKAQAIYWRAKLMGKTGDYDAMDEDLCKLCSKYDKSFYCLFSKYYYQDNKNDENNACHPELVSNSEQLEVLKPIQSVRNNDMSEDQGLTRIRLFLYLGLRDEAIAETLRLRNRINANKETSIMLASIFSSLGEYNRAMYTIRPYIPSIHSDNGYVQDERLMPLVYPAGYTDLITKYAAQNNLDPYLVHAIIREESWFNKEAVSPAGALGLMQLMPGTAKRLALDSYAGRESLFEPETNIQLGTKFFADRLKQFDGNIFLAIASYNAGPEAVKKWINEHDGVELDEFIEGIPYKETREYVKKVFKSYMEYHRLYKNDTKIDTL